MLPGPGMPRRARNEACWYGFELTDSALDRVLGDTMETTMLTCARFRTHQVERIRHALLAQRLLPRLSMRPQLVGGIAHYLPTRFLKGTADAATEAAVARGN